MHRKLEPGLIQVYTGDGKGKTTAALGLALRAAGQGLQVVVIPWAEVFLADESIGQTPMGKVPAAVGQHALALRHPELGEQRKTVVIRPGETTLVRVTLQGTSG